MAEEKNLENRIKKFLKNEECWCLKYWAGGGFTKSGIPDLLICCNGHFIGAEIKASDNLEKCPAEIKSENAELFLNTARKNLQTMGVDVPEIRLELVDDPMIQCAREDA